MPLGCVPARASETERTRNEKQHMPTQAWAMAPGHLLGTQLVENDIGDPIEILRELPRVVGVAADV